MINVAYVSNDAYFIPLSVSIKSLLINNKSVFINIFENNISDNHKEILTNIVLEHNCSIHFYNTANNLKYLDSIVKTKGSWNLTYSKLFIGNMLVELDKVLFIDTDTVIDGDLSELYETDLSNYIIASVDEITSLETKIKIGLREDDNYFNAGVMLINLTAWRKNKIELKCFEYIKSKNGEVYYMDQGTMNNILSKHALYVHPKYNVTSQMIMKRKGKPFIDFSNGFYSLEQYDEAVNNPVIIHFTGMFGCHPWNEYCVHYKKEKYEYYLSKLPANISRNKHKMSKVYFLLTVLYYNTDERIFNFINKFIERIRDIKNAK